MLVGTWLSCLHPIWAGPRFHPNKLSAQSVSEQSSSDEFLKEIIILRLGGGGGGAGSADDWLCCCRVTYSFYRRFVGNDIAVRRGGIFQSANVWFTVFWITVTVFWVYWADWLLYYIHSFQHAPKYLLFNFEHDNFSPCLPSRVKCLHLSVQTVTQTGSMEAMHPHVRGFKTEWFLTVTFVRNGKWEQQA